METTEPKGLDDCFNEGLEARLAGDSAQDNPYPAGSEQRREWSAGFHASAESEDESSLGLAPGEVASRRAPD